MGLRVALLTSEYPDASTVVGGTGNYMRNIARALYTLGHHPIVIMEDKEGRSDVQRQDPWEVYPVYPESNFLFKWLGIMGKKGWFYFLPQSLHVLRLAKSQARAFSSLHREMPFDLILSVNLTLAGLFIKKNKRYVHLVRITAPNDLYAMEDGVWNQKDVRFLFWLEKRLMKKADRLFAPSETTANYLSKKIKRDIAVIRSPFIPTEPIHNNNTLLASLPDTYLIHFGQIGKRKGSEDLAMALLKAWKHHPDLKMVWAGHEMQTGNMKRYQQIWGRFSNNVIYLGPLEKTNLLGVLQSAKAAVLPSRVDNLPNTIIESLNMGVPVIGTIGSSIDELVEDNKNGLLVQIGDVDALAKALIKVWEAEVIFDKADFIDAFRLNETEPRKIVSQIIGLAKGC